MSALVKGAPLTMVALDQNTKATLLIDAAVCFVPTCGHDGLLWLVFPHVH